MNQFVPQLILGSALDSSSGPPHYTPKWGNHKDWAFGAHYFFETYNIAANKTDAHAAYVTTIKKQLIFGPCCSNVFFLSCQIR